MVAVVAAMKMRVYIIIFAEGRLNYIMQRLRRRVCEYENRGKAKPAEYDRYCQFFGTREERCVFSRFFAIFKARSCRDALMSTDAKRFRAAFLERAQSTESFKTLVQASETRNFGRVKTPYFVLFHPSESSESLAIAHRVYARVPTTCNGDRHKRYATFKICAFVNIFFSGRRI